MEEGKDMTLVYNSKNSNVFVLSLYITQKETKKSLGDVKANML